MMALGQTIDISKFLLAISSMNGLSDPAINNHNYRVAFISYLIGKEISFSNEFLYNLLVAGLLHDIGLLLVHIREDVALLKNPSAKETRKVHLHAEVGYELLRKFPYFSKIAKIVKYHHYSYQEAIENKDIPFSAAIVNLADRIDIFIINNADTEQPYSNISRVLPKLEKFLKRQEGKIFSPKLVDIFLQKVSHQEAFWYEILNENCLKESLERLLKSFDNKLPSEAFYDLSQMLAYLIDFKSPFTATHSSGVAQTAASLASFFKFTSPDLKKIKIAGLLHDIGKVAIPLSILEKQGKLTEEEFNIMKSHVFYSYKIISRLNVDNDIIEWASYHHETLDGEGYPFRLTAKELSLGSRIMAVADIFTALREDRPYKKGLPPERAISIIDELSKKKKLDKRVVNVLRKNLSNISMQVEESQKRAKELYHELRGIVSMYKE
ncbi:HD-GYP domain-containing protein [Desulfurobacterium sp. TC5-1]|uniref:HD-GYP domain-containing protein n=1 Tax=Desulfurobacterium sp. TC5-1 TaxID=1158318 RepID=UPI0003B512FD|nr:HD-GYP domain-containing protein [Desulfurobacterium sp. TC5-1]